MCLKVEEEHSGKKIKENTCLKWSVTESSLENVMEVVPWGAFHQGLHHPLGFAKLVAKEDEVMQGCPSGTFHLKSSSSLGQE